jgi:NADPH-dependent ferric siderophore reductase
MTYKKAKISEIKELPGFRRIVLSYSAEEMPLGGYVKVITDTEGPIARTISISQSSKESFSLDFATHESHGPVATWQRKATVGDELVFKGPGPQSALGYNAQKFLFFGDLTAFPAIRSHLVKIQESSVKEIAIYVGEFLEEAKAYFSGDVKFLTSLDEALELLREGDNALWAAGERTLVKSVRDFVKNENLSPKSCYMSSYWQQGHRDEEHKKSKIKG